MRAPPPKIGRSGSCPYICLGDNVEVSSDYQPGICSEGGCGLVLDIRTRTVGDLTLFDVQYILDGRIEKSIQLERLSPAPLSIRGAKSVLRSAAPTTPVPHSSHYSPVREKITPLVKISRSFSKA